MAVLGRWIIKPYPPPLSHIKPTLCAAAVNVPQSLCLSPSRPPIHQANGSSFAGTVGLGLARAKPRAEVNILVESWLYVTLLCPASDLPRLHVMNHPASHFHGFKCNIVNVVGFPRDWVRCCETIQGATFSSSQQSSRCEGGPPIN